MFDTAMQVAHALGLAGAFAVILEAELRVLPVLRKLLARADEAVSVGHRANAIAARCAEKVGVSLEDVPAELDEAAAEKKAAAELPDATPELVQGFKVLRDVAKPGA